MQSADLGWHLPCQSDAHGASIPFLGIVVDRLPESSANPRETQEKGALGDENGG